MKGLAREETAKLVGRLAEMVVAEQDEVRLRLGLNTVLSMVGGRDLAPSEHDFAKDLEAEPLAPSFSRTCDPCSKAAHRLRWLAEDLRTDDKESDVEWKVEAVVWGLLGRELLARHRRYFESQGGIAAARQP